MGAVTKWKAYVTKTERAWKALAEHLELKEKLRNGHSVQVSAGVIHSVAEREPRLMMKFDFRSQRPSALRNATILPVANGEYLIVPGDGYHDVEPATTVKTWRSPGVEGKLLSLPWQTGPSSESQLIDMAKAAGVLNELLDEDDMHLTVRGRLRSPEFSFEFSGSKTMHAVSVSGVQVEVDAGFEGEHLHLIEAKLGSRTDFHVRQLYYPFRMWQERLPEKEIKLVFLSYSDQVMSARLYDFSPETHFNGIRLLRAIDYQMQTEETDLDISQILENTPPEPSPQGVTFPQADDMRKVIDIIDATEAGVLTNAELCERYEFVERQANYYATAARYLGFIGPETPRRLTDIGHEFANAPRGLRHRMIVERLAALPVFRESLQHVEDNGGELPSIDTIASWLEPVALSSGKPLTGSTLLRRAQTVVAWVRWVWAMKDGSVSGS